MAAVAAEAFIDEFACMLVRLEPSGKAPALVKVGSIIQMLEDSHVQITEKFQIASQLLPGDAYGPGQPPFDAFRQLIKLRNSLVHPKFTSKPPGWFPYFVSNRLVAQTPDAEPITFNWTAQLQCRACAKWACQATARIVLDLIERIRTPCNECDVPGLHQTLASQWEWTNTDFNIWN